MTATPALGWVTNLGSTPGSIGTAVAIDHRNNDILFAAYVPAASVQVLIARYTSAGTQLWSQSLVSSGTARVTGLAIDPSNGDVVVGGSFSTTLDFGSCGALTSAGGSDIFIARYTAAGACRWAESFGGSADDFGNALAIDGSGEIVATGSFTGQMNFGDGVLLGYAGLGADAFLVKLQANGTLIRSVGFTNPYTSAGQALAIAPSGDIYVTGNFDGTMTLGGVQKTSDAPDIFVARIPADLNLQNCPWWAAFGGMGWDQGYAIALDNGDPIIAGIFGFKITDPIDLGTGLLRIYGSGDGFVAKFAGPNSAVAREGTCLWSTSFGSYNYDAPYGIAVDSSGNGFLAGQFGPSQGNFPGAAPIAGSGMTDAFASQFDANSGTFAWARGFGGTGQYDGAIAYGMALDSQDNVVLAGYFSGQVDFCGTALVSNSYRDFFLASVQPSRCQSGSGAGGPSPTPTATMTPIPVWTNTPTRTPTFAVANSPTSTPLPAKTATPTSASVASPTPTIFDPCCDCGSYCYNSTTAACPIGCTAIANATCDGTTGACVSLTPGPGSTATPTRTATMLPTRTPTPTNVPTLRPTVTSTPRATNTAVPTSTLRPTSTPLPSSTPKLTNTPTRTSTRTPTSTPRPSNTPTATKTRTPTPTPNGSAATCCACSGFCMAPNYTYYVNGCPLGCAGAQGTCNGFTGKCSGTSYTATPTAAVARTATPTATRAPSLSPTPLNTPTRTLPPVNTPTPTATLAHTAVPTATRVPTSTPTWTSVPADPTSTPTTADPASTPTPGSTGTTCCACTGYCADPALYGGVCPIGCISTQGSCDGFTGLCSSNTATPTAHVPSFSPTPVSTPTRTMPAAATATPIAIWTATAFPTSTPTWTSAPANPTSTPTTAAPTSTPAPAIVILQAQQDSWIQQVYSNVNKGTDANLYVKWTSGSAQRSLVQFDLTAIPAGACVNAAVLRLTPTNSSSVFRTFRVHRVTNSWTEGTGVSGSGVTWNARDGVQRWGTAGGDFLSTATASIASTATAGSAFEWDVTPDVAAFVSGNALNNGWLVKDSSENGNIWSSMVTVAFASHENPTPAIRPQLVVIYTECAH